MQYMQELSFLVVSIDYLAIETPWGGLVGLGLLETGHPSSGARRESKSSIFDFILTRLFVDLSGAVNFASLQANDRLLVGVFVMWRLSKPHPNRL